MKNIYDTNETMQLIGKQYTSQYLGADGIAHNDFMAALNAHESSGDFNLCTIGIDFFALGMIYGKRIEREKQQQKT